MDLVVLANREPVRRVGDHYEVAVGGLAAALFPVLRELGGSWVAWNPEGPDLELSLGNVRVRRVGLSPAEVRGYYGGFANRALWPLMHGMLDKFEHRRAWWRAYQEVNRRFARAAERIPARRYWVHDYHLALAPALLREARPGARIGVFWHVPWPPASQFFALPEAEELMAGLLGANLIGFHTEEYRHYFLETARALGYRVEGNAVWSGERPVRVGVFPIGVDTEGLLEEARGAASLAEAIRRKEGERVLFVGADRLDYTKGIPERIKAWRRFLARHRCYRDRARLRLLLSPSRSSLPAYRALAREVRALAREVGGRYPGALELRVAALSRAELLAHYRAARFAAVTPLKDGMNLVAQEFSLVGGGIPLLSRFAGAADYLKEALIVNPYDEEGLADAFAEAMAMDEAELKARKAALMERVRALDVRGWARSFLEALDATPQG